MNLRILLQQVRKCYPGLDLFSEGPFYTWADPSKALLDQEEQWDESLEYVFAFCKKNGPFHAVYGFSQGTAIITNFSHPKIWRDKFHMESCPWKFAILACGGASHHISTPKNKTVNMPSFHIFGKKDEHLIDSKKIANYWDPSKIVTHTHDGGHVIDARMYSREKEMMKKLINFLDDNLASSHGVFEALRYA
mmetsp:Transcript_12402/g.26906  ORF Transcript_12402/g.26906 Transcript_12402/m.26906 type:complete len:192 (-) Transcript_12402:341-916(-)